MFTNFILNRSYLAVALLTCISFAIFIPTAESATLGFDWVSIGSDTSTATGHIEIDSNVPGYNSGTYTLNPLSPSVVTAFNWTVAGGNYDGLNVNLLDLTDITWNAVDTAFIDGFNFSAQPFFNGGLLTINRFGLVSQVDGPFTTAWTHTQFTPAVVPIPSAIAMFIPGLAGLLGFSSRRKKNTLSNLINQSHSNAVNI